MLLLLSVACQDYEVSRLRFFDTFDQEDLDPRAELLFVVDDSKSMQEEQEQLAANFSAFVEALAATDGDFQIGVVTTDVSQAELIGGLLVSTDPDLTISLTEALAVGADGHREEQGLEAARQAVTLDEDFPRAGARFNVMVFSDEDDQSPDAVGDYYEDLLDSTEGGTFQLHAIVGDLPAGCASGTTAANSGDRYLELAEATDGFIESICATSYDEILERMGLHLRGLTDTFYLSDIADPETLQVKVDGEEIDPGEENGWTYDVGDNAVVFHGESVPPAGSLVDIQYNVLLGGTDDEE